MCIVGARAVCVCHAPNLGASKYMGDVDKNKHVAANVFRAASWARCLQTSPGSRMSWISQATGPSPLAVALCRAADTPNLAERTRHQDTPKAATVDHNRASAVFRAAHGQRAGALTLTRACMPSQTQNAADKVRLLLQAAPSAIGIRIDMTNDWGSHTGFTYTLGFATADNVKKDDEKIELEGGGVVFVDRKTLWVGEGGLLGATMDIDDDFSMKITPKEPRV